MVNGLNFTSNCEVWIKFFHVRENLESSICFYIIIEYLCFSSFVISFNSFIKLCVVNENEKQRLTEIFSSS